MLFLMKKFYPQNLSAAVLFLACISIPPKLLRLQFKRLKYVLKAFRDFFHGVQGSGDLLPDFDTLARQLAARTSAQQQRFGLREKLAGAELRAARQERSHHDTGVDASRD